MRLPDAHHVGFRLTGIEFSLDLHQVLALLLGRRERGLTGRHGGPPTMGPGTSYYSLSLWSPVPGPVPLVQLVKASPRLLRISRAMAAFRDAPPKEAFTRREWPIIRRCRSPEQVQRFLRSLPYNWERGGDTLRSFREVVRRGPAQGLEATLVAAGGAEPHRYHHPVGSFQSKERDGHGIYLL